LTGIFELTFPYLPQQVTLLNWLVIGIPAFVIALSRERSRAATRPNFLKEVGGFALRTGISIALAGLILLTFTQFFFSEKSAVLQQTMLLSLLVLLGLTALFRALTDGETLPLTGDKKIRFLGILAIPVFLLAVYWPFSAGFFGLVPLHWGDWIGLGILAGVGLAIAFFLDRWILNKKLPG
jgi:magnesium-transporting ATPase (P-type)